MPENIPFAKELTTKLCFDDLVLRAGTLEEIKNIIVQLTGGEAAKEHSIPSSNSKDLKLLFSGLPGTGKTLAATLIGKATERRVFSVSLDEVVNKYLKETEKNLARVFDMIRNTSTILLFDEADALFGKRTEVNDGHDRYANQEVSYLLQKIEEYKGTLIFSTTKSSLDPAFIRRMQDIIYFKMPGKDQRLKLWKNKFGKLRLAKDIELEELAEKYPLSGGDIDNIYGMSLAMTNDSSKSTITKDKLLAAIGKLSKV